MHEVNEVHERIGSLGWKHGKHENSGFRPSERAEVDVTRFLEMRLGLQAVCLR